MRLQGAGDGFYVLLSSAVGRQEMKTPSSRGPELSKQLKAVTHCCLLLGELALV